MDARKVLVVEDEYAIRDLVALNLKLAGYEVEGVESAERALEVYNAAPDEFDIALLDIMLPQMSGLELCEHIRRENPHIGIIMLTAKTQETDKIEGFAVGADDYVTKPFSTKELVARVDAVYRRTTTKVGTADGKTLTSGDFVLDTNSRTLTRGGEPVDLTQVEYQLMELFFENPGVALDRDRILKSVWGRNYFGDVKIVDVNICRLRIKIEEESNSPKHIITVWGYGYRWNA
ncbi:MAG: response regulator transcription factor [Oscillospiraceae bacterium]|nr:response regulator transcription factor [Oscillospiraceae bacterium]